MSDRISVRPIRTREAVTAARTAIDEGARIVIARGLQAELIRSELQVPLVEIRLTAQEIGLLARRAADLCRRANAVIGLLLFRNSVGNIGQLQEVTGLKLVVEYVDTESEIPKALTRMTDYAYRRSLLFIGFCRIKRLLVLQPFSPFCLTDV